MKTTIGIIGRGVHPDEGPLDETIMATAREVGRRVAERGGVLVSGGLGGVMEAASEGAHNAGGLVIGFLPQMDKAAANLFVDIALPTGLGTVRNLITARGCDALIMIGGGCGTLNELTIAYAAGRPTIVLRGSGGWADRLEAALYDGCYVDDRRRVRTDFADTPAQAVEMAFARAVEPPAPSPFR
jgi:uncharacterized protein (TIGR00725 family)